ncbi:amidohydrolase family protein [Amycolatopsis sp. NPDC047767]|uniref:amidohydrolase family protein n=1 Tax=Amycolatopsis sp. NPDC047767 TaxID=3156765 RepID=UPI003455C13C
MRAVAHSQERIVTTSQDSYPLVIRGGRVLDPESGFDAVADVGITGGTVSVVSATPLQGAQTIDATGLVVAPGFVDLHSHGQAIPEQRLQALDGVTTALELEAGITPVGAAYARAAAEGRPVNYGYSTSWALARMAVLAGAPLEGPPDTVLTHLGVSAWRAEASAVERARIFEHLSRDLADGALGVGVLAGYAPHLDPAEFVAVAELAAEAGLPAFTHARPLVEADPDVPVDGAEEIARVAGQTGVHLHYCHVNSTSGRHVDRVLGLVERCRLEGAEVTTEAYPYGAGSTAIGAAFLAPEVLARQGIRPDSLVLVGTGERIADAARLAEVRASTPGALALLHFLDEDDPALERALLFEGTAIASDAMPLTWTGTRPDPLTWPLPPGALGHPRGAGTFSRAIRRLYRESGKLTLSEAVARCSLLPAQVLDEVVPALWRKGRLRAGSDADVVVFDPARIADQASYVDGTRPSVGIEHVLVNGTAVVRAGSLVPDALPGKPVRA